MLGILTGGDRIQTQSDGAVGLDTMLTAGVREHPTVDALATRSAHGITVLVWNYQDEDVAGAGASVDVEVDGLPKDVRHVLVRHYRIDQDHSNAYTVWKKMGSPQHPNAEQYATLESAGHLQLLDSPLWFASTGGKIRIPFNLPLQALSLLEISW
jgi:xylan 1,4-beta-xylosidase